VTLAQLPVYLIAHGDRWLTALDEDAALAFGTEREARAYAAGLAKERSVPASVYRIVEYAFTGRVMEG
jgi:hypothetical protein